MSRLPPPGVLSENDGDGELGGRVMELMRLGPLSILPGERWRQQREVREDAGLVRRRRRRRVVRGSGVTHG